jgi:glycosyltransferase involved in cell wall biosynthesis
MRIALFTESFLPKQDGVATTLCYLLEHLAVRGHDSLMFAPEGAPARYAQTPIVGLSGFAFPLYPELKLVPPLVDVQRQLADFEPDVVHLVNPASLGLVGLRHARAFGLPVVASYHTDIPGYAERYGLGMFRDPLWAYFRWLHNQADLNLCPSGYTRAELESHGFQRVKVWSHGVDTERYSPCHYSEPWRLRLSNGCAELPLLLYVGRLATEKRVDWLRDLLEQLPEVRLAIVGDGPLRSALEELFANTPTVFTGYLQGADLAHAYASADLFVFPSANETFGNVVLEAMASGLPVIAPRSGGPVDQVVDGENGFLFESDDMAELVSLTRWLISDPSYIRQLGATARAYAELQSWEGLLDALLDDYASLIMERGLCPANSRRQLSIAFGPTSASTTRRVAEFGERSVQ